MKTTPAILLWAGSLFLALIAGGLAPRSGLAASFTNQARVEISDSTGGLSWNPVNNALTVQAWFKISVPSGVTITEDMTILVNRKTGTATDPHAYLIFFNIATGKIEFSARGSSGVFSSSLIDRPYLDRWYHVAVVRKGEVFSAYVDGRLVFSTSASVGNASTTDGVSIGGWGSSKYLFGEVQEVSIYQTDLGKQAIVQYMFTDQPASDFPELQGYYKLAYSTNAADNLKNFALAPVPQGTESAVKSGSGTVAFEETDQAGEQSYFDAQKNNAQNYQVPLSGAFSVNQPLLSRPTPGISFDLRFGYSSANNGYIFGDSKPPLGLGWRHVFEARIIPAQEFSPLANVNTVGLLGWDGSVETWDKDPNTLEYRTRSKQYRGELVFTPTNCLWTTPERLVYVFRRPDEGFPIMDGRLTAIRDFNGNSVQILYNQARGEITNVIDTVGGRYAFLHTNGLLRQINFGNWSVSMAYDATNRLISISKTNSSGLYAPADTTWQFGYNSSNSLLERMIDPRGNTNTSAVYDKYGRRIEQRDALGRLTRTEFGVPDKRQIRNTDAEGNAWIETYDRKHRLLSRKDPLGNGNQTTYDEASNPATITEPLGYTTYMAHDQRGNITDIIDALTNVSRRVIHPFFNKGVMEIDPLGWTNVIVIDDTTGNLLRNYDALGNLSLYTYRPNGLVETSTDGNGRTSRFTYNTNGFLISQTDAAGYTTSFAVNELGWKLAQTNALGEVTTFSYDLNGKVVRTVDALSRAIVQTYDANGNVLSASDAKGQFTYNFYDAANQRTQMVDRAGNVWRYTYTLRGQAATTTDPLGFSSTNTYDAANRLIAVSDALGSTVRSYYDANGKVTNTVDQAGQSWRKAYDRLGRVVAEIDPQGDTKTTTYDAANRVQQITSPNGYPSTHEYDGRARLKKWTDPEGYAWRYDYDGLQNITNITDALGGHYVMAYGPRNERLLERNQDNFEWRYEYDELLRLKRQTDPNGTTRTLNYDSGGRVLEVDFNTGRVNAFQYDRNNNPKVASRSGSGPATITSFSYDALDRVTETSDAFGNTIGFGYDSRGLRTTLTYPDGKVLNNRFDPVGRLTNQVDWAGRQMTYAYDSAGRLIRRTYPNGVSQTNNFDISGQLTGLSYASPALSSNSVTIALTYAYDRNGNKVGSTETGVLRPPMPSLTDEKARFTASGRLVDRQITPLETLNPQPSTLNYLYDPSGNMTNAAGAGQTWALTYDEDNRTTSVHWDAGLTAKHIVNRYDALGRRVAKTVDGLETRYSLDLSGGMERILCDMNTGGAITAWYVHGPDLAYKVDAANNLTCFHADAMANIIALSDGTANTIAQYAYTPYGRIVGSTNLQSQASNSYLFVGSQGVMEELPGLYFMRARYYSAEAAVFLSTDPVKNIGPGWKPEAYTYANGNPLSYSDPAGLIPSPSQFVDAFNESIDYAERFYGKMGNTATTPGQAVVGGVGLAAAQIARSVAQIELPLEGLKFGANWLDIGAAFRTEGMYAGLHETAIAINQGAEGFLFFGGLAPLKQLNRAVEKTGQLLLDFSGTRARYEATLMAFHKLEQWQKAFSYSKEAIEKAKVGFDTLGRASQSALHSKSVAAARYANARNAAQGAVPKQPSAALSMVATIAGDLAADAFGRVLPKSTPPVVREAAKVAVGTAVVAAIAGPHVAIGYAVVSIFKAIFNIFAVPKPLIFVLVFLCVAALFQYWRYRRYRRLRDPVLTEGNS